MTNLSCNASTCTHNADKCCCLSGIDVKGANACTCDETCCGSFDNKKENGSARNAAASPKLNLTIQCAAHNCVYNEDCHCHADEVCICGSAACDCEETCCGTFKAK